MYLINATGRAYPGRRRQMEPLDWIPEDQRVPPDERAPKHRVEARVPVRGGLRPRLPVERPAGRARPQARQGDGRPPQRLGLARLRAERVHDLPLAGRPRAVRGLRGPALRGAPGLPRRARAPRAVRAPDRRRASSSRPTTTSRSASSGSRRASSAARAAPPADAPAAEPAARRDDDLPAAEPRPARAVAERGGGGAPARERRVDATVGETSHELEARTGRPRPLEGLRHPGLRPERLAAPRRGAPGGRRAVHARRPRLDERHRGQRQAREGARARGRRPRSRSARPRSSSPGGSPSLAAGFGLRSRRHSLSSRLPSSSSSTSSSGGSCARRPATSGCRRSR